MGTRDIYNNVEIIEAIEPVAVGTTGTGQTSRAIDLKGYDGAVLAFSYGAITSATAVFTATVLEGDTTNGAFTSVADADLNGTEAGAGVAAATRVDYSTEKITKQIGYVGTKRYIKAKVVSAGTAGTPVAVNVIRGKPHLAPTQ